jgi:hypothetical protein
MTPRWGFVSHITFGSKIGWEVFASVCRKHLEVEKMPGKAALGFPYQLTQCVQSGPNSLVSCTVLYCASSPASHAVSSTVSPYPLSLCPGHLPHGSASLGRGFLEDSTQYPHRCQVTRSMQRASRGVSALLPALPVWLIVLACACS